MCRATRILISAILGTLVAGHGIAYSLPAMRQTDDDEPAATIRVAYQPERRGGKAAARWIGQDGQDFVGPNNRLEPSDVQDVHIALTGLDPARQVVFIDVKGQGGDQWQYNAQSFSWKAELKRVPRATTADLYLEPGHVVTPSLLHITLRYDTGETVEFDVRGRKVNPQLRMPNATLKVQWAGFDRQDRVGKDHAVGPDGIQDARIRMVGVSTKVPVKAFRIEGPGRARWESGANPNLHPGAEFWADPKAPGQGELFFQPDQDLKGQKLKVVVLYANDTFDSATLIAGRCDPRLRVPESAPLRIENRPVTATWKGQNASDVTGPGDVHVHVEGLKQSSRIVAAVLTDSVRGTWVYQSSARTKSGDLAGEITGPLGFRPGADRTSADLFFAPYRDERQATFTLRTIDQDGRMAVSRFPGGACDPARRARMPGASQVQARPGDDLNALVRQHGTVLLSPGIYRMSRPLILDQPVTLMAKEGATLLYAQPTSEPPWTAAIKIHAGNTTLEGFSVRFEGQVRWDQEVSYGPAVIGTTDNHDQGHEDLKVNVVLSRLDLEIPAAADPSKWVEALRLIRLTNARSGTIAGNTLRGGPIEFFDGPWLLSDNQFRGTPPGTFSHGVFTGHNTHDLTIRGNRVKPVEPAGKTWRFLVLTNRSCHDIVEKNLIEQIGARDEDTIPWSNEPEIILTEGYHLTFEGRIQALALEGQLLRIGQPQGQPASTGDVVSFLTGPAAGRWTRISQVIDPVTYLVEAPVPKGTEAVSISRGFVHETFQENTIDVRGGRLSDGMVLVGNHFGTRVVRNHFLGGAHAIRFTACPTETPVNWGWSHAPFQGGVIEDNILEDSEKGGVLGLEHSVSGIRANKGRTYMSVTLNRNVIRWSEGFLSRIARLGIREETPGLTLGYPPSLDAAELSVTGRGNWLDAPDSARPSNTLTIHAALISGQRILDRRFALPRSASTDAELVRPGAASTAPSRPRR